MDFNVTLIDGENNRETAQHCKKIIQWKHDNTKFFNIFGIQSIMYNGYNGQRIKNFCIKYAKLNHI